MSEKGKAKRAKNAGKRPFKRKSTSQKSRVPLVKTKKQRNLERPHGAAVEEAKLIWNKARHKKYKAEDRVASIANILVLFTPEKMADISTKHDGSRVVQFCITNGNTEQRSIIAKALAPAVVRLSKTAYGRFVVKKLLVVSRGAERKLLLKQFKRHMAKLGTNAYSASVVECAYDKVLTATQCQFLFQEFYGAEFVHFPLDKDNCTLQGAIKRAKSPEDAQKVLGNVLKILIKQIEKNLQVNGFVQYIMWQYFQCAGVKGVRNLLPYLVESMPTMLNTNKGMHCCLESITCATAKQRKKVARALKDSVLDFAAHPYGHLALLRLLNITDDTVTTYKNILAPMLPQLATLAMDPYACKILVHLLHPHCARCFPPEQVRMLQQDTTLPNPDKTVFCKKDPDTRRSQLLDKLRGPLRSACSTHARTMMCGRNSAVLLELFAATDKDMAKAIATASLALGDGEDGAGKGDDQTEDDEVALAPDQRPITHTVGHNTVKRLLKHSAFGPSFAQALFEACEGMDAGELQTVADNKSGAGALVILAETCKPAEKFLQPYLKGFKENKPK